MQSKLTHWIYDQIGVKRRRCEPCEILRGDYQKRSVLATEPIIVMLVGRMVMMVIRLISKDVWMVDLFIVVV